MNKKSVVAALALLLLAAGCSKNGPQVASEAERGPVVARVNGSEIYQGQISAVLSRLGNIPPEQAAAAGKQVLDKLVEENLILQQAQEKKLEQDPKVVQALGAARNEILIKAYLEQVAGGAAKPTEADLQSFYDKNPVLFKERKVYNLRELTVNARPDMLPKLQDAVAKAKSLEEVANWLRSEKVGFSVSAAPKAAEQLPGDLVAKFAAMKDGETVIVPTPSALLVVQVVASQVQPVDLATAKPAIERLLMNQKRNEAAANEVKQQKAKARIEYLGQYAAAKPGAATENK